MVKFFKCDGTLIKFSHVKIIEGKVNVKVKLIFKDRVKTSNNCIVTETYYFDFDFEFYRNEQIRYKGVNYNLYELRNFFRIISTEIKMMCNNNN